MDIRDFENNGKYKLFLPILYVVNWALMLTGPFFYPVAYQYICFAIILFMAFKSAITFICCLFSVYSGIKTLKKAKQIAEKKNGQSGAETETEESTSLRQNEQIEDPSTLKKELYAFIIPSYREDPELLG